MSSNPLVTGPKILDFIFVTLSIVDLSSVDHLKYQGEPCICIFLVFSQHTADM
jgi:hypothetical protein